MHAAGKEGAASETTAEFQASVCGVRVAIKGVGSKEDGRRERTRVMCRHACPVIRRAKSKVCAEK